jgi:hypothetical protein
MINLDALFKLLAEESFKDPNTGNLFFPAYIYTYDPKLEYEFREQIMRLEKKLQRPNHYLECQILNIYQEIISYLKAEVFAGESLFDEIITKEREHSKNAHKWIKNEIELGFYEYLQNKIEAHFSEDSDKRVYLLLYGFGSAFPYLRASEFLVKNEEFIKKFKVIIFYPGNYENANYHLFEKLDDENMYRANYLNKFLPQTN